MVRLTVITSSFGAAVHMGANVEFASRTFDLPPEVAAYIEGEMACEYVTVSLAIERAAPARGVGP